VEVKIDKFMKEEFLKSFTGYSSNVEIYNI
jgi:hypothetical protein